MTFTPVLKRALAFLLIIGAIAVPLTARTIGWPDEKELTRKADVVAIAKVLSIAVTREVGNPQWTDRITRVVNARIEVNRYVKGVGPKEIKLRYLAMDPKDNHGDDLGQGPMRFALKAGMNCVFFLKKVPSKDWDVTVLEDQRDNAGAVWEIVPEK